MNLASAETRIIFKDLKKDEKKEVLEVKSFYSREREELKIKVEDELDKILLQEYDEKIVPGFTIQSLKEGRRELVASFRLGGTPVLVMMKLKADFTSLQEAFCTGILRGLEISLQINNKKRLTH